MYSAGAVAVIALLTASCTPSQQAAAPAPTRLVSAAPAAMTAAEMAQTQAFFGDLHMHTGWSFDAYTFGTTATPDDAYNFAQGAPLAHPAGGVYKLDRPLDFLAVTDHSEFIGVVKDMGRAGSPLSTLDVAKAALSSDPAVARTGFRAIADAFRSGNLAVFGDKQDEVRRVSEDTWSKIIETANRHNKPGKFTALIGYEWTASEDGRNLHRNVIFRGDTAPLPFTSVDSRRSPSRTTPT
jgi:hypothetical protein